MKNLNLIRLIIASLIISLSGTGYATAPTYTLSANNFVLTSPNSVEFDIYMKHTNPGSDDLTFVNAQYIFNFNTLYANGGILSCSFVPGSSDLPFLAQPRSPSVMRDEIRLACNAPLLLSSAPIISSVNNGTRIMRVKLVTTASAFAGSLNLRWKNSGGFSTKLNVIVNSDIVNLTDSLSNQVQSNTPGIINIKLALEGLYNQSTNSLNRKDIVTAYLRNASSPFQTIDSAAAVIDSLTLTGAFSFANAPTGTYYFQISHRNSIETWSKAGGESFTQGGNINYDFTTAASKAYGDNLKLAGSKWCIYTGDVDRDGTIDASDIILVYNDLTNVVTGNITTDLNGDEIVDVTDLLIAYNNSKNVVNVIKP